MCTRAPCGGLERFSGSGHFPTAITMTLPRYCTNIQLRDHFSPSTAVLTCGTQASGDSDTALGFGALCESRAHGSKKRELQVVRNLVGGGRVLIRVRYATGNRKSGPKKVI